MEFIIFTSKEISSLTDEVNVWLKKNPKKQIRYINQSESAGDDQFGWIISISIFYEER